MEILKVIKSFFSKQSEETKEETLPLPTLVEVERAEWDIALTAIQSVFSDAVLAGGAIRNNLLGLPAKDYDIFVPFNGDAEEAIDLLTKKLDDQLVQFRIGGEYSLPSTWQKECKVDTNAEYYDENRGIGCIQVHLNGIAKDIEIVLMPCGSKTEAISAIREWALPLNWGVYDGTTVDIPEEMEADLILGRVSVIKDLLVGLSQKELDRAMLRSQKLAQQFGWPTQAIRFSDTLS